MCLGIPAQIVELVDADAASPRPRSPAFAATSRSRSAPRRGSDDWVLVHVGFALSRIDEEQARETLELLEQMGEAYEQELREIRESAADVEARALHRLLG